ncbi:MAG: thermonuclease family protein [Pseudomonadota bacterium]|nr:thermonuclease family protein [Pseudomonadota bacterium]
MSKHWNPNEFGGGSRYRSGAGFGRAEIGIMLSAGIALGLIYAGMTAAGAWFGAAAPEIDAPAPDYYAESRKSREILRAQEDGPLPRFEPAAEEIWTETVGRGDAVDVIDGDTFRYGGETIRIADIDTPETNPPRCAYEAQLGERATQRLAVLLAQAPFKLEPIDRDADQYGRKLRIVTRGGRSLGDQLVSEGLARTWTGRRQPWC